MRQVLEGYSRWNSRKNGGENPDEPVESSEEISDVTPEDSEALQAYFRGMYGTPER